MVRSPVPNIVDEPKNSIFFLINISVRIPMNQIDGTKAQKAIIRGGSSYLVFTIPKYDIGIPNPDIIQI